MARLIERRHQSARWVFVLTALPVLLFGLMGAEHGALPIYAGLAGLCLVQCFYPTLLGWALVLVLYATGSVVYLYTLGKDGLRVARGQEPSVFLNAYDTTFFLFLVAVLVGLTVVLIRNKPVLPSALVSGNQEAA